MFTFEKQARLDELILKAVRNNLQIQLKFVSKTVQDLLAVKELPNPKDNPNHSNIRFFNDLFATVKSLRKKVDEDLFGSDEPVKYPGTAMTVDEVLEVIRLIVEHNQLYYAYVTKIRTERKEKLKLKKELEALIAQKRKENASVEDLQKDLEKLNAETGEDAEL